MAQMIRSTATAGKGTLMKSMNAMTAKAGQGHLQKATTNALAVGNDAVFTEPVLPYSTPYLVVKAEPMSSVSMGKALPKQSGLFSMPKAVGGFPTSSSYRFLSTGSVLSYDPNKDGLNKVDGYLVPIGTGPANINARPAMY